MPSQKTGGSLKEASMLLRNLLGTRGTTCSLLVLSGVLLQGSPTKLMSIFYFTGFGLNDYHVPGLVVVLYIYGLRSCEELEA
jgi:hypothetical protein